MNKKRQIYQVENEKVEELQNKYNINKLLAIILANREIVEKEKSLYYYPGYTDKQSERNILSNPFKRFEDMDMFHHTKTLGIIEVDSTVWKKLTDAEKKWIESICDERLEKYYQRISK